VKFDYLLVNVLLSAAASKNKQMLCYFHVILNSGIDCATHT